MWGKWAQEGGERERERRKERKRKENSTHKIPLSTVFLEVGLF
jgi:hypothetical protein